MEGREEKTKYVVNKIFAFIGQIFFWSPGNVCRSVGISTLKPLVGFASLQRCWGSCGTGGMFRFLPIIYSFIPFSEHFFCARHGGTGWKACASVCWLFHFRSPTLKCGWWRKDWRGIPRVYKLHTWLWCECFWVSSLEDRDKILVTATPWKRDTAKTGYQGTWHTIDH